MIPTDFRDAKDKYAIKVWEDPIACIELFMPQLTISPDEHILLGTINSKKGMEFRVINAHKLERHVVNIKADISV